MNDMDNPYLKGRHRPLHQQHSVTLALLLKVSKATASEDTKLERPS